MRVPKDNMKPQTHLCKKSETLQLPHLLDIGSDQQIVHSRIADDFSTLYAYTEFHFATDNARIWWVKEFGVN